MHFASLLSLTACFEVLLEQKKVWVNMKYIKEIEEDVKGP